MDIEKFRDYCLSLPFTSEKLPFDENTLVFYVKEKMFTLTNINTFESVNLKCDPEKALELREEYPEVLPGYHMNKKHWNTVLMNGNLSDEIIKKWVYESYLLVVNKMKKSEREEVLSSLK